MVYELGHVRDQFKNKNIGIDDLQKEGGVLDNLHKKRRCGVNNVNKFIGKMGSFLSSAKNYMDTTEGENWASDLINHLNSRFPTSIDTPKLLDQGSQNFIQQELKDANLHQIVSHRLISSHSSLPDLLVSPVFHNASSFCPPESYMNLGYNGYNPASVSIYNPGLCGGSAFNDYSQNVASSAVHCGGMNSISPFGVKQTDLELITSPEQVSSVTACSYGDVVSDTEAFDSIAALPGSVLHSTSGPSATNSFQQQPFHKSQYRSSIGKKKTAYNMDVPSLLGDDVQSPYSNLCNVQQNLTNHPETSDSLESKCNTQISDRGDSLQPQIHMPVSQQPDEQAQQHPVQFDDRLKTRSNMLFINGEKSSDEISVREEFKIPQINSEKSPLAQEYAALESSSQISSFQVLSSYVMYKDMPADLRREVPFQDYMHAAECKENLCNCPLYLELASHFDKCNHLNCDICGPARSLCSTSNFHLESRKRKKDQAEATHDADPSSTATLLETLPTKYPKTESPTVGDGFSQEYADSLDQHSPLDQPQHLEQRPEAFVCNEDVQEVQPELLAVDPSVNCATVGDTMDDDQRRNFNDTHGEQESTELKRSNDNTNNEMKKMPELNSANLSPKEGVNDEKEISNQVYTESGHAKIEANFLAADAYDIRLDSKKSMMPSVSLADHDSVLESEKTKIKIAPLVDDDAGVKPEKIKIQSVSLADFFTAAQIREHLLSFSSQKDVSGKKAHSVGHNTCHLCSMDKLVFAPAPIYCSSCDTRIKRNVGYYRSTSDMGIRHCFCMSCYRGSHGTNIVMRGFSVPKANLQKAKNDEEKEDSWVLCDRCQCWQHRICGLYNDEKDVEGKADYICPKCYLEEIESGMRVPLPQTAASGAKDLPRTNLSDHIEERLSRRLNQEREEMAKISGMEPEEVPGAEGLVVRVVVSVEKQLAVRQKFIDILHGEDYPSGFTYRSKLIFLFQKIEGVDVCLFGMCVQEFGSECGGPNHRCLYISYLDSVKYFRPERKSATGESLRTFVYHELLIGYLEYCKKRGFATCYIWACPLIKGEDYIFYCHPETQRTPKQDKLRQWYKSMLKKAVEDDAVVDHTNLYNQFFVSSGQGNTKITAARLPYFDGDYWSGAAENIVRKLEVEESAGGLQSKLPNKRILKAMGQDRLDVAMKDVLVMQKLGQTILPVKENFMIVHLQYICTHCHEVILSGSRWFCSQCKKIQLCSRCFNADKNFSGSKMHTCHSGEKNLLSEVAVSNVTIDTKDKDDVLVNSFFETRDAFLNKCQKSHFQFDTLARAKYSSMMILYHLIHKPVTKPICTACHKDVLVDDCWHCDICAKFYVCESCYKMKGGAYHPHMLNPPSNSMEVVCGSKNDQVQKHKALTLKAVLDALIHASQCERIPCSYSECRTMRRLFYHASRCTVRVRGGCRLCQQVWRILKEHSQICKDSNCKIPRCMDIKKHKEMLAARSANLQTTTKDQQEMPQTLVG
ncbi:histone acetyltransferase HAC12-like isoform X3 [Cynara cardunculus var. scolymus]|uniref:histone acetyltransferase HAC12-like isoform X3 n=1 Tax=Cynara cardunculus var. scolymus TaxID=59895 RepID=UPI000D62E22B|nr:histone acetyltransferase HAC12-like isoform X3 [Cynara cardunculus var. scolymus]